jgi:hypothetical protein
MGKSGVDGIAQIGAGVDQGSVKVEGDEVRRRREIHFLTIIDPRTVSSVRITGGGNGRFDWSRVVAAPFHDGDGSRGCGRYVDKYL